MLRHKQEILPEISRFVSLDKYPLNKRVFIYLADILLFIIIKTIGKTVRYEVEGWRDSKIDGWESYEIVRQLRPASIFAFWHNRIFLMTDFWKNQGGAIMVSQSFDGEYISRIAQRFGYGVIRGSSSRGGAEALRKMVGLLKEGCTMAFTIDGPKGPRYKVKPGAITLSKQTSTPVCPILIEAKRFWTARSWDKLQIPAPFTRAKVFIGEPIFVSRDASSKDLKNKQIELQTKLDELVFLGKQWREGKN